MSFKTNIFYDKTIRGYRHILTKDKWNWVYCYGKEGISIENMLKNENNTFFYTSMRSFLENLFEKRLKSHFTKMEVHEFVKAVNSAYRDVIEMSRELEKITEGMLQRTDEEDGALSGDTQK